MSPFTNLVVALSSSKLNSFLKPFWASLSSNPDCPVALKKEKEIINQISDHKSWTVHLFEEIFLLGGEGINTFSVWENRLKAAEKLSKSVLSGKFLCPKKGQQHSTVKNS